MVNIVHFEETIFVTAEGVGQFGRWDEESREQIHNIRNSNPEISHWGDLAVGMAISNYSRNILAVSFAEWVRDRDTALMAYIYIRQKYPDFDFGSTNNYMDDLWDYCDTLPWLNDTPCPKWVEEQITQNKAALNRAHEYQQDLLKYHGDLLKSVRVRENLSQLQFAEIIHIKQSELFEIEDGKRSLSKEIAQRVQEAFGPDYRFFDI